VILAHRIRMNPTAEQTAFFRRACGTTRFTFNWALAEWKRQYAAGEKPSAPKLKKQFNATYPVEFPWVGEVHRDAHSQPFVQVDKAFKAFFKKKAKYPKFKKKGRCKDSFYLANDKFRVEGEVAVLPKIGKVELTEALRFDGKIVSGTVSRDADRWFLSVQVELPAGYRHKHASKPKVRPVCGVDLGVTTLATLSTGEKVEGPKALKKSLGRLRLLSRQVSRKVKGSRNRGKAVVRLARQHRKVRCLRHDFTHKLTSKLCRENQAVVVEDLNVKGMTRNRCLSRALGDQGFGEIRRQLAYKVELFGCDLVVADRWFPSSKTCSDCGAKVTQLPLHVREWTCSGCGVIHDRDVNAAVNLAKLVTTPGYGGSNACGQEGSGRGLLRKQRTATKPAWVKQEPIRGHVCTREG